MDCKTENNDFAVIKYFLLRRVQTAIFLRCVSESQVNVSLQGIILNERNVFAFFVLPRF